jgi:hypothetical protein
MTLGADYRIRRPRPDDGPALAAFGREIWPAARPDKLGTRWWWHDPVAPHSWIAEHVPSGAVAALCGERRTRLVLDGEVVPASTICDWDVSPQHKGGGLGRALVEAGRATHPVMYTTSISDSAATAFARLGWSGDERVPIHVGIPAAAAALSVRTGGLTVRTTEVSAGRHDGIEQVEALWSSYRPRRVTMVRDGAFLRAHLAMAPHRSYQLAIALAGSDVVGYMLSRALPSGSFRRLRVGRMGLIADFLTRDDRPDVIPALVHATTRKLVRRGCIGVAALTTDPGHARAFERLGLVSARTPLVGGYLGSVSIRCMQWSQRPLPSFASGWYLTFADNDMDLIFGSAAEDAVDVTALRAPLRSAS